MRISRIDTFPVDTNLIVKIETSDGLYGIGEAGLAPQVEATVKVVEHFKDWVIGRHCMDTEGIWQELFRYTRRKEGSIICSGLSGIDMALWDIKGKALGVPVYQLLGGKARDRVELYAHIGGGKPEDVAERSREKVREGFRALRFGFDDPKREQEGFDEVRAIASAVANLAAVREAVGEEIRLCVDVHQRLSPAEAVAFCREVEPLRLMFVEDPIRPEAPEAYKALRQRVSVPLASGENLYSKWQFRGLIDSDSVDYLRVDLGALGGFTEARKVAAMGEARYQHVVPHCAKGPLLEQATLHFSLATSNAILQEHTCSTQPGGEHEWWNEILPELVSFEGGTLEAPTRPGLGIEFDEAAARRRPRAQREMPRWKRRDGSVQDW